MAKEKQKKPIYKRWWAWAIAIIVIIIIAANMGGGSGNDTATTTAKADTAEKTTAKADNSKKADSTAKKDDKTKTVGVGEPATVDNVTFTVNKVETKSQIEDPNGIMEPAKASGKYIVLNVTIKNGQKDAITMNSSFFKLKTDDGTTYKPSTDGDVMMVIPTDKQIFLEQVNPGITKKGIIVYDVPKDLKLSDLKVHCQTGFWGTQTINIKLGK